MLPVIARKTSDTPRPSTTTTTADPELQFQVEANAVYVMDGWIKASGDPAADLTLDWTAPTGSLGEWTGIGAGNPPISTNGSPGALISDTASVRGYLPRLESTDLMASRGYGMISTTDVLAIDIKGTLRVGSTAGTYSLDWAQTVSNAAATTLYTDSWLRLVRVQ
jgi:hypothetical protein